MDTTIPTSKKNPATRALLAASFPAWKGRKVRVRVTDLPVHLDTAWSGGSRDEVVAVRLTETLGAKAVRPGSPWSPAAAEMAAGVCVPRGFTLVVHSRFCGKDAGVTVHVHPDDAVGSLFEGPALPASA